MFPTVEAFWLAGQWPNTPTQRTGATASSLATSATRALTATRTGTATSPLSAVGTRSGIAVRTGTVAASLAASATRTLTTSRTGTAQTPLSTTATRSLAATRSGASTTSLSAAATRALTTARTGLATTPLSTSGARTLTTTRSGVGRLDMRASGSSAQEAVTATAMTILTPSRRPLTTFSNRVRLVAGTYVFSAAYTTGGETFTMPPFVQAVVALDAMPAGGYTFQLVAGKLKAFAGTSEVAAGTNLSALVIPFVAYCR